MSPWLGRVVEQAHAAASLEEVFCVAREAARELNFEYCAYLLSELLPCARPKTVSINSFPEAWQRWCPVGRCAEDGSDRHSL